MANRFEKMTDDELRELGKQKTKKNGCFTRTALAAQRELWNRKHWETVDPLVMARQADRDLNDYQYNG